MQILSHRGVWKSSEEKNGRVAILRSWENGFGMETDVRDHLGGLAVSHDVPTDSALKLSDVVDIFNRGSSRLTLAINIKADGLSKLLRAGLADYPADSYFTFDMSVPEMVLYIREGLVVFTRHSDVEPVPVLLNESRGVWLDSFYMDDWITPSLIRGYLDAGKRVCVVSPELHRRAEMPLWTKLRADPALATDDNFLLCTDNPEKAKDFFTP